MDNNDNIIQYLILETEDGEQYIYVGKKIFPKNTEIKNILLSDPINKHEVSET